MLRILFKTLDLAVAHARAYGGWVADCGDGTSHWFDASVYTMTRIMLDLTREGRGDAVIGPWPMFDPAHPSHVAIRKESPR